MPIVNTNFIAGRMNQSVDERLVPPGEYIEAINCRLGATETSEIGAVENSKGNDQLTTLYYNGAILTGAKCIGAYEDGAKETLYWFVTSPTADMIVSFNTTTTLLNYHVIDAGTVLNFDSSYLITGVNKLGDLLFWTDNLNPPRKINITKTYLNVTAEDVNVIVQPPVAAPSISLITQATEANYMETRMISFAYRYQYKDDEYSAISQFSDIAFVPGVFSLDIATNLNSGMKNIYNAVNISFNTGGSNVTGIDLIFKFADSNLLNIIEKFKKEDYGWPDNSIQTQSFSNSKIYTILPESELLRLYDNVPLVAKAQTVMANRLIYGNYHDGRNLIDANGSNSQMTFETEKVSAGIDVEDLTTTYTSGVNYTIDTNKTVANSTVSIDLATVSGKLNSGAFLDFTFTFSWDSYTGNSGTTTGQQTSTQISTIFTLPQKYNTVYEMASSDAFKASIGSSIEYFQTVANACTEGTSFTDTFNCAIENPVDSDADITWGKTASGITGLDQGVLITTAPGSDIVSFQIPAMKFLDTLATGGTVAPLYGYYKFTQAFAIFLGNGNTKSLHSNRNYEVGVVYMDEYLRSTTALVSPDNTVFIPASDSENKNQIKTTIPITQRPPSWATRYKFVVKRAEGPYETIFSNFYYSDTTTNTVYFKLEGQNQSKVKTGDILRVKTDNNGALSNYQTAEALAVSAQGQNFLTPKANIQTIIGGITAEPYISELPGLYMEMKPTTFSVDTAAESTGWQSNYESDSSRRNYPSIQIPCFRDSTSENTNLEIPEGSLVTFNINFSRTARGNNSGARFYSYDKTFQASQNYANLYEFVIGENIDFQGGTDSSSGDENANDNTFYNTTPLPPLNQAYPIPQEGNNRYQFRTTSGDAPSTGTGQTNFLYLAIKAGTQGVGGHKSRINGRINVQLSNTLVSFETIPVDVDNDIYYEDDKAYDITGGFHMSGTAVGDQNQTATLPAIMTLGFFDCFAFGNGIESFKVQDSLVGQSFTLGQRVTSVSSQDFKEADRYAGLTYSGIYNEETNINRLNEFNLGLVNFKDLEVSYGPIQILSGRETDILVLQEDKISYVLAGKNLLSSAAAGGAITNTAEVLGTQIARLEEYGISHNPESFITHGFDKYFTDAKRNSVLKLSGSGTQEQLTVVSEIGMRSYFRDLFIDNFDTQKLGGFDPYMNEYVLSNNDFSLPVVATEINCNSTIARQGTTSVSSYTVNFGTAQGNVKFTYVVTGSVNLKVVWNGAIVINQVITGSSFLSFNKSLAVPSTAVLTVTPSELSSYNILSACPQTEELKIIQMTLGTPADNGKFIHNQYYWTSGSIISATSSELIEFQDATTPVESWISTTGQSSVGLFPVSGAEVILQSNKKDFDDFVFDNTVDKFKYLVSNTAYVEADWATITAAATNVTPITNPSTGLYQAPFTYSNPTNLTYLYLIWDYRTPTSIDLRHGTITAACCTGTTSLYYIDTEDFLTAITVYDDANLFIPSTPQFYQSSNVVREQVSGAGANPNFLLPPVTCDPCGTAIPLCFSTVSADDVCCTGCTYTTFNGSIMKSTRTEACGLSQSTPYYHNGTGSTPVVNNFVYSDDQGTTIVSAGYYSLSATSVIYVNSSGMVQNLLTC